MSTEQDFLDQVIHHASGLASTLSVDADFIPPPNSKKLVDRALFVNVLYSINVMELARTDNIQRVIRGDVREILVGIHRISLTSTVRFSTVVISFYVVPEDDENLRLARAAIPMMSIEQWLDDENGDFSLSMNSFGIRYYLSTHD